MNLEEMERIEEDTLGLLREIALPGSFEYLETNQQAAQFIAKALVAYKEAMLFEDSYNFELNLARYSKGWTKVWMLMAKEHFHSRDIHDVDMRFFKHLPDGYSFIMKDTSLGFDILVVPRNPSKLTDMRWVSAGTLLKMHKNPIIMKVLKAFPDSWFGKSKTLESMMDEAIKWDKEHVKVKLKFKRTDKHGFDWYG